MKVLLEIDNKATALLEVLSGLLYVKAETVIDKESEFLAGLKEAIEDVKLIKAGKLKGRPAKELLNEF